MAQKYHLSDDGQPRECNANIKCPKGGDAPHFEGDLKEARAWAEEQNAQEAGGSFGTTDNDRTVADYALDESERNLKVEEQDLFENKAALKRAEDRLDEEEANVDRLQTQGADEAEIMDAEDDVYIARTDVEYHKENIDNNLEAIEEIEGDLNFAKMVQGTVTAMKVNDEIETAFHDNDLGTGVRVDSEGNVFTDNPDSPVDTPGDDAVRVDEDGNMVDRYPGWKPVEEVGGDGIINPSGDVRVGVVDHIRENPGTYVALSADTTEEEDNDEFGKTPRSYTKSVGWVLMKKDNEDSKPDYDTLYKVDDKVKNLAALQRNAVDSLSDDRDFDNDVTMLSVAVAEDVQYYAFKDDDFDNVTQAADAAYKEQKEAGFSKKESMKSAVTAATQKAYEINEGYSDYYKGSSKVSNGTSGDYQGHPNKDSWTVSAEVLDNDEKTYKESLKLAKDKNATGKDLRNLVTDREYENARIADVLEDVEFDDVDWDEKLKDIRESHDL